MEKLLSIIVTAAIVFYVLKLIMRIAGPWLLGFFLKRTFGEEAARAYAEQRETAKEEQRRETGTERLKTTDGEYLRPHRHEGESLSDMLGGEYIDYENC